MPKKSHFDLDILDKLFEKGRPVVTAGENTWVVEFTFGKYHGYTLTLAGTGFSGGLGLPGAGTVTGITFGSAKDAGVQLSGISLDASVLLRAADLDESYDDGEEGDDDLTDDDSGDGEQEDESEDEDDYDLDEDDDIICGGGDDNVKSGSGSDDIRGGRGRDRLDGEGDDDSLQGEAGDDSLAGGKGRDHLDGGEGKDVLYGGAGKDTLKGGSGSDKFVFKAKADSGVTSSTRDVITDFLKGDKIDFSAIDANSKVAGNQKFAFVAEFTKQAGQLEWDKVGKAIIVSGDLNGDGKADFSVQVNASKVFASDFLL